MKYLGLILVLALVAGQVLAARITENNGMLQKHDRVKRSFDDKLRQFLEGLKLTLREGNETLGIPVMDPFVSEELKFNIDQKQINGTAELRNIEVHGLAAYRVDKSQIKLGLFSQTVIIGLTWPYIFSEGSYKFDVNAFDKFDVTGDGEYEVGLTDLSFESEITIGTTGGVKITGMQTSISLAGLKLVATGIFGDDEISAILSEVISDVAPQLIVDYQRELTDAANAIVTKVVNEQLKGMSLKDILAMLG